MSDTSIIFFSLSVLLVICLSASHVVKRKAPDGKLYVFANREGCESVQSERPCTLTWQLNPFLAKIYKQNNEIVALTTKYYRDLGINFFCLIALEKAQCSQATPRCLAENGTRDYGNVGKQQCRLINIFCPQSVRNILKDNNFCASLKTGKYPNSPCVAASTPITGVCPQPKYKMPSEFLTAYIEKSSNLVSLYEEMRVLTYDNGDRIYSSECLLQLEEINCSPTYCSANESQLLIKHDRDDCNKIIKECFDDVISKLSETSSDRSYLNALKKDMQSRCDTYPTASTAKLQEEPLLITLGTATTLGPQQPKTTPQLLDTSPQSDTTQQPDRPQQPDIPQQPDTPQQPDSPQQQDTPRQPDTSGGNDQPPKSVNRNRRPTSTGSCQLDHHILLATLTYFVIKIYV